MVVDYLSPSPTGLRLGVYLTGGQVPHTKTPSQSVTHGFLAGVLLGAPGGIRTPNLLIHTGIGNLDTCELRHTTASLAIAAGADVKTAQLMLGHSSATTTLDVYVHLWEKGLESLPGAMDALMAKEYERLAVEARAREVSEAESRRAWFKVIG